MVVLVKKKMKCVLKFEANYTNNFSAIFRSEVVLPNCVLVYGLLGGAGVLEDLVY